MDKMLKRFVAVFLLAASIITTINPVPAQAAIPAPKGLRYVWAYDASQFDFFGEGAIVEFRTPAACDGYQLKFALTNGKTVMVKTRDSKRKAGGCYSVPYCVAYAVNNANLVHVYNDHVTMVSARVYKYNGKGKKEYSAWTGPVIITPWPERVKKVSVNKKARSVKLEWNTIYGSDGYNVFVATNPSKWYWNQSTAQKATATTATIKTFRGRKLEKHKTYYVRVVTRKKGSSGFIASKEPYAKYYNYTFRID